MVTLDLKLLLLSLLILAGILLLIFLTIAVGKMITSLKHMNSILEDVKVVTEITAERSKQIDEVVSDVTETVKEATSKLKGNKSVVKAASSLASLVLALKNIATAKAAEKDGGEDEGAKDKVNKGDKSPKKEAKPGEAKKPGEADKKGKSEGKASK